MCISNSIRQREVSSVLQVQSKDYLRHLIKLDLPNRINALILWDFTTRFKTFKIDASCVTHNKTLQQGLLIAEQQIDLLKSHSFNQSHTLISRWQIQMTTTNRSSLLLWNCPRESSRHVMDKPGTKRPLPGIRKDRQVSALQMTVDSLRVLQTKGLWKTCLYLTKTFRPHLKKYLTRPNPTVLRCPIDVKLGHRKMHLEEAKQVETSEEPRSKVKIRPSIQQLRAWGRLKSCFQRSNCQQSAIPNLSKIKVKTCRCLTVVLWVPGWSRVCSRPINHYLNGEEMQGPFPPLLTR